MAIYTIKLDIEEDGTDVKEKIYDYLLDLIKNDVLKFDKEKSDGNG